MKIIEHFDDIAVPLRNDEDYLKAELSMARDIQRELLMCTGVEGRNEFCVSVFVQPAMAIGGDFYDYFLIDDDHLGFIIADVSGKGVPAAMFMMRAKTIISSISHNIERADTFFNKLNNLLCANNDYSMFVTAVFGLLEISTGKLTFANAGHNLPIIKRANGVAEEVILKPGFVLGGWADIKFEQFSTQVNEGDLLLLYTDGLNDALGANEEFFGIERILNAVNSEENNSGMALLSKIKKDLVNFTGDVPQQDDVAMFILEYFGAKDENF